VAMHFKAVHNRPRPSHLCPALMPPIPVPGHASYPSGHATQANLMALFVTDAMPPAIQAGVAFDLTALATRIGRNREIAGMHYASDSAAGVALAASIHTYFAANSLATGTLPLPNPPRTFGDAVLAAQAEWP
jgi:membrane-associated phospholipid phosphatase